MDFIVLVIWLLFCFFPKPLGIALGEVKYWMDRRCQELSNEENEGR